MSENYIGISRPNPRKMIIVSGLVIFICVMLFPIFELINFQIHYQNELVKCPACLGKNMCNCFLNNKFKLNWDHFWTNLLNILFKKSIIFGSCGDQKVVLKWVEVGDAITRDEHFFEEHPNLDGILKSMKRLPSLRHLYQGLPQDFVICPTTEKLDSLLKPAIEINSGLGLSTSKTEEIYRNIFYILQVNMEPLIQLITSEWAVARYLGACGDISVSEYCGNTLTWVYPKLSWKERSSIANQLLIFALNATFANPEFAFYFTDLSSDNFAVSDNNEVRLIDLDNVIVVDKNPSDPPDGWNTIHTSYHDKNIEGFGFSTDEICSHGLSDTNVYGICQGILSVHSELLQGGLLHSLPPHLPDLEKLVEDCTSPPAGQSRFDIAHSMLKVLDVS